MRHVKNATVIFIVLLSVLMFPVTFETFLNLHRFGWHFFADNEYRKKTIQELSQARSGEYVLPVEVQTMIELLRANKVDSFRFSRGIATNDENKQRLVEGAYPIKVSPLAHYILLLDQEPLPAGCHSIMSKGGFTLAYCS